MLDHHVCVLVTLVTIDDVLAVHDVLEQLACRESRFSVRVKCTNCTI